MYQSERPEKLLTCMYVMHVRGGGPSHVKTRQVLSDFCMCEYKAKKIILQLHFS